MSNKNYWYKIASYDLNTAKSMLDSKRFIYVGFMCHQAIEKILKGIYSKKYDETPPRTHNLARLLELNELEDELPSDMRETLKELNPLNVITRYPEENLDIMDDFTQNYSEELLQRTRRLFKWLKKRL